MSPRAKVFISATSKDLGNHRRVVAALLKEMGYQSVHQDEFPGDWQAIQDMLRSELTPCHAVLCLVGNVFGMQPHNLPEGRPRRSYTQMEFDMAIALDKPTHVLLADGLPAPDEPAELQQLQADYREALMQSDELWHRFTTLDELELIVRKLRLPANDSELPRQPRNLPYASLGPLFKGRDEFVRNLHQQLQQNPQAAAAIVARQAIHGLGGVGKTRLAVEYAWQYASAYPAGQLFVPADDPQNLQRGLAELTAVLDLPERHATEEAAQAEAVLRWLETHPGWLLILDNADAPPAAEAVEQLLPRLTRGHVLITSRLATWGPEVERYELDVLAEAPAVEFLLLRTENRRRQTETDEADAAALARELDNLALALEQAGSFIDHHRTSLADYHRRWRDQDQKVRTWYDERTMKYPRSVATTWETSFEQLDAPARDLLGLLAWLAPDPIPQFLFPDTPQQDALGQLATYSLAKEETESPDGEPDARAWRVHRLVQEITRLRMSQEIQQQTLTAALTLINTIAPNDSDDVRTWSIWDPLRPHIADIIEHGNRAAITDPTTRLMNDLGLLLYTKALFQTAEPLMLRTLAIDERTYGAGHPYVARDLSNLAMLFHDTDRREEAERLMRPALAINEQSYGDDHRVVGIFINNLAMVLKATDRLDEAEPLLRRALAIDEVAYGPKHSNVGIRLNNLARLLQSTGRNQAKIF